jgi:hypothetical protein
MLLRKQISPGRFAAAAGLVLVFLTVWSQSRVDRLQVRLDEETHRGTRLESRVTVLRTAVLKSTGLREVEAQALGNLGMITPPADRIAMLDLGPAEPRGIRSLEALVGEAYAAPAPGSMP